MSQLSSEVLARGTGQDTFCFCLCRRHAAVFDSAAV